MSISKRTGLRYAELPAVDVARFADNAAATRALEQIRQILQIRFGQGNAAQDRAVTWGDLLESGIVSMVGPNGQSISVQEPGQLFRPVTTPEHDATPPPPTGLRVTPGLATIVIEWDQPTFDHFGYAQIWRATTDNLARAVNVGQSTGWVYADPVTSGATFYYWVRFVSKGGKEGDFNAVKGTVGTTTRDPSYLMNLLSVEHPQALLVQLSKETTINGVKAPAGVYMRDMYVANGSISNAKIGNLAVDDAKIASLSAAKITFGQMSGDRIAANSLNADRITVDSLFARLAVITQAYIGTVNIKDAQITSAKIADAAITAAKIANAQITAAKIADASITNSKIANLAVNESKIANLAVTAAKIADLSVTSAKLRDAAITTAKIGNLQVDTMKIADNAVSVHAAADAGPITKQPRTFSRDLSVTISLPAAAKVTILATTASQLNYPYTAAILLNGTKIKDIQIGHNVQGGSGMVFGAATTLSRSVGAGTHTIILRQSLDLPIVAYRGDLPEYGVVVMAAMK
ncbi:hypothetical protein ACMHYO_16260 [Allopusillimonas ginsengisoli]|uniref:hypothetical protein n=1 Tax=Allopusillimonas ginsengisoli TaxID=453575 RepID=UPI0039C103D0